jgi:hypothetical protein
MNYSHTPISDSVLTVLSSASLTGLSNKLTLKLNSVNARIRELKSRVDLLSRKTKIGGQSKLTDGPIALEKDAFVVAKEKGIDPADIFENPPTVMPTLEEIESALSDNLDDPEFRTTVALNSAELISAQTEHGSLMAVAMMVLEDIGKITATLEKRAQGTEEEPRLNYSIFETVELDESDLNTITEHQNFIANKIVRPIKANKAALQAYEAQKKGQKDETIELLFEINLVGPPISTDGKFILSETGLYYDSRNGGIPEVVADSLLFNSWKLTQAPNKGGKGIHYNKFDLEEYSKTVFSEDYLETNSTVEKLYEIDKVLENIEQDKSKHIGIVSSQINELIASGYAVSSSFILNSHRSVTAIAESYDVKLRKRKKQLQLAGLFGKYVLTNSDFPLGENSILLRTEDYIEKLLIPQLPFTTQWQVTDDLIYAFIVQNNEKVIYEIIPIIPINDFSFLKGTGLIPTIESQKEISLQSGDVNDVVLPIKTKYVKSLKQNTLFIQDFSITKDGVGSFIHTSGSPHVSSVAPFIKSITDDVVSDGLIAMYNFLDGQITAPNGTLYAMTNDAKTSVGLNAKLVSPSLTQVFPSGVGFAYMGGTLYNAELSESPDPWYNNLEKGSYLRLPNNFKDGKLFMGANPILDLTYNENGFTLESWVHIPTLLTGMESTHRYRILFGNENTGAGKVLNSTQPITASKVINENSNFKEQDYIKVHGMLVGFAVNPSVQSETFQSSDLRLGIWPTVSQNDPTGKWGPSVALAEKVQGNAPRTATKTRLGMEISPSFATPSGKTILSVSGEVNHFVFKFDYKQNSIAVYLDSELLATSSLSVCFNTNPGDKLEIPSPTTNSDNLYLNSLGVKGNVTPYSESLHEGLANPSPGTPIFTPWIIGGGFTDTIKRNNLVEQKVGNLTPLGFLGSNTNDSYWTGALDASGSIAGQHLPGLGGDSYSGVNRKIPRSGLDGFVGSVKFYNRPLNISEVVKNYNAQKAFFKNIRLN